MLRRPERRVLPIERLGNGTGPETRTLLCRFVGAVPSPDGEPGVELLFRSRRPLNEILNILCCVFHYAADPMPKFLMAVRTLDFLLTTFLPYRCFIAHIASFRNWSVRDESNIGPVAYEATALPLSYGRSNLVRSERIELSRPKSMAFEAIASACSATSARMSTEPWANPSIALVNLLQDDPIDIICREIKLRLAVLKYAICWIGRLRNPSPTVDVSGNRSHSYLKIWCAARDLNPHSRRNQFLRLACLPFHQPRNLLPCVPRPQQTTNEYHKHDTEVRTECLIFSRHPTLLTGWRMDASLPLHSGACR